MSETTTESFFEDMVIDTPEALKNLEDLIESGVVWKRGNSVIRYVHADSEEVRRIMEKYTCVEQERFQMYRGDGNGYSVIFRGHGDRHP